MEVFELPFMSTSAEATSQAVWDYYTQYGNKEFPAIKALAVPCTTTATSTPSTSRSR